MGSRTRFSVLSKDRVYSSSRNLPSSLKRGEAFKKRLRAQKPLKFLGREVKGKNMRFEGHVDVNLKKPDIRARVRRYARLRQYGLFNWKRI